MLVNPEIEPLDDELVEINEGCLSVPDLRGEVPAPRASGSATSTATGVERERGRARADRGHLPARGRPSRRGPVPRPGRRPDARSTTWEQFERFHRDEFVERGQRDRARGSGLVTDATGASSPGSAARRPRRGSLVELEGERIARGRAGVAPPAGASGCAGLTLPGLANAHSHAFQRALRGRAAGAGAARSGAGASAMYELAGDSIPRATCRLARATFAEMALAGITAVGEFHYLHHGPGRRRPTRTRTRSAERSIAAAARGRDPDHAARRLLSARRHPDTELDGAQRRFSDGDAEAWAERVEALGDGAGARDRRRDPQRPGGRPRLGGDGRRMGRASASARCTPTSPSSRPRTRPASPPTGATPTALLDRRGGARRPRSPPSTPPTSTAPTSPLLGGGGGAPAASARPPSATSPTAIGPARGARRRRRRRWRSAPTRTR